MVAHQEWWAGLCNTFQNLILNSQIDLSEVVKLGQDPLMITNFMQERLLFFTIFHHFYTTYALNLVVQNANFKTQHTQNHIHKLTQNATQIPQNMPQIHQIRPQIHQNGSIFQLFLDFLPDFSL